MEINPEAFQESITAELDAIKNRVRNLIGDKHWGEEGRYKEAVLRNVIRRFLPSNLSVGTGFIIRSEGRPPRDGQVHISTQIDIIIYDNRAPVLFSEGDFVIVSYTNVKAIVEVKTRIRNNQLTSFLKKSVENGVFVGHNIFNGVFAYEYSKKSLPNLHEYLEALKENGKYINCLSLGSAIFVRYWPERNHENVRSNGCRSDFFGIYDFASNRANPKKLSFSYFISNLAYSISENQLKDRLWLLFPADGGKESFRIGTACLRL
jgi:hypothetical protein